MHAERQLGVLLGRSREHFGLAETSRTVSSMKRGPALRSRIRSERSRMGPLVDVNHAMWARTRISIA